jgi:hypothetical protein
VSDREATAYHEAGHAVAAVWLHRPITRVTIDSDAEWLGDDALAAVEHATPPLQPEQWDGYEGTFTERDRRRVEAHVMVLWAGTLVEEQHTGEANDAGAGLVTSEDSDFAVTSEGGDLRHIVDLAYWSSGGDPEEAEAYIEWLRCRTLRLTARPDFRVMVNAVAAELLDKGGLSGRRVHAVAKEAVNRWAEEQFGPVRLGSADAPRETRE